MYLFPPLFNFFAYPLMSRFVPQFGDHWSIAVLREISEQPSSQLVNLDFIVIPRE